MSRIYHNETLQNLPLINKPWPTQWDAGVWTKKGNGALVEGVVQKMNKLCITDSGGSKARYFVLYITLTRAHRRKFDGSGKEIEPNFSDTAKVSTGYLNSSYKTEQKGATDVLSEAELSSSIAVPELKSMGMESSGTISLWLPEAAAENVDIECGAAFRFKTQGDSPFISSFGGQEGQWTTVRNYAGGDQVGASWTDKVMAVKGAAPADAKCDDDDAIGDDEWDD